MTFNVHGELWIGGELVREDDKAVQPDTQGHYADPAAILDTMTRRLTEGLDWAADARITFTIGQSDLSHPAGWSSTKAEEAVATRA